MFDETGETCILDQPEIAECLQPLIDMYNAGVSPSVDVVTSISGDDMFISGKIAMITAGIWKVPSFNNITTFNWDVVEIPFDSATGGRKSSSNVLGLVINPNTLTQYIPYAQFTTEYVNALTKAYRGEATMQDALTEVCALINGVMEENKAQFAQ